MLAITILQIAVVAVTAAVLVLCAAFAVMETRRIRNAGQYSFANAVQRAPHVDRLVPTGPVSLVDKLMDSLTNMSVEAVRAELTMAS